MEDDDLNYSFGDDEFGVGNSTFNSVVLNESLESSFEVENDGLLLTSTPTKSKKGRNSNSFKVPKPPPDVYFRQCILCKKYLKREHGFKQHMQAHKWKECAQLSPPVEEVLEHWKGAACSSLEKLIQKFDIPEGEAGHLLGVKITTVLKDVKCNIVDSDFLACVLAKLSEVLRSKNASKVMPSALRSVLQSSLSAAYSCKDFREQVMRDFLKMTPAPPDLAWNIIFCFCKEMFDDAFIYICQKLRGPAIEASKVHSKDDFNHYASQQVVHFISGACLKTHFRHAYAYPNNQAMRNVKDCILLKFARIGAPSVTDRKNAQYWTSLLNRKSLLFLHLEALPFFIELCKLLQKLEGADGSLNHERVMESIVETRTLTTLWDSIVDNSLSEEESFNFMVKVVKSMTNTFGKGIMLRRMNSKAKSGKGNKTTLAVSHRARLIGKM